MQVLQPSDCQKISGGFYDYAADASAIDVAFYTFISVFTVLIGVNFYEAI